jgi:hypothetical protein
MCRWEVQGVIGTSGSVSVISLCNKNQQDALFTVRFIRINNLYHWRDPGVDGRIILR